MKLKIFFILLLFTISASVFAQHRNLQNQPYVDRRPFHIGFTLGIHTQDLILTQSGYINENEEVWFSEIPNYSPGLTIGIIGDAYINRYTNLRVIPTILLGEKNFVFKEQVSGKEYSTSIRNNYISIPFHL